MNRKTLSILTDILENYVYGPYGRLVELLSLLAMTSWLYTFLVHPDVFAGPIYRGFASISQPVWATIFASVIFVQSTAIIWQPKKNWNELRFVSIALTSAIWSMVTLNFYITTANSTATGIYFSMSAICFLLGVRLAWKPY